MAAESKGLLSGKRPSTANKSEADVDAVFGDKAPKLPANIVRPDAPERTMRKRGGEPAVTLGIGIAYSLTERLDKASQSTGETKRSILERALRMLADAEGWE